MEMKILDRMAKLYSSDIPFIKVSNKKAKISPNKTMLQKKILKVRQASAMKRLELSK